MPLAITCPACAKRMQVRDEFLGQQVQCPACRQPIKVGKPAAPPPPLPKKTAPAAKPPAPKPKVVAVPVPVPKAKPKPPVDEEPVEVVEAVEDDDLAEVIEEDVEVADGDSPRRDGAIWWLNKNGGDSAIIALGRECVWVGWSHDKKREHKATIRALEENAPLSEAFADNLTASIPYEQLKRVQSDSKEAAITFTTKSGFFKDSDDITITPKDKATRNEVFDELLDRLGSGWTKKKEKHGAFRAAMPGLILAAVTLVVTIAIYAMQMGEGSRSMRVPRFIAFFITLANFFGPWGTLIIGGLVTLAGLALMLYGMMNPPTLITLTPSGKRKPRKRDDDDED